jgi:hypothetical protein
LAIANDTKFPTGYCKQINMIFRILVPLFCWFTFAGFAQDSVQLTNNFEFNNGVYLTIKDLQNNQPNYNWQEVKASAHINRDKNIVRFEYLNLVDSLDNVVGNLTNTDFWGICVDGVPYIRVADTMIDEVQFVGLRTRGKICYFEYDSYEMRSVPMTIYDPKTRKPVWVQYVDNKEPIEKQKMMDFSTGIVEDLDIAVFKDWIKNDAQLINTIDDLSEKEVNQKLYKMMLIYNDRHPYFVTVD